MNNDDALQLIRSLDHLSKTIADGCELMGSRLEDIDVTLSIILEEAGKLDGETTEPVTANEVFKKVSDIGAKAVLRAILDWEKRVMAEPESTTAS